jgi:hypothetical protein
MNNTLTSPWNPGDVSGHPLTAITCDAVRAAAKSDGFKEPNASGKCGRNCHVVRLYIATDAMVPGTTTSLGPDYHWYRLDDNGAWSSKHGRTAVGPQTSDPDKEHLVGEGLSDAG